MDWRIHTGGIFTDKHILIQYKRASENSRKSSEQIYETEQHLYARHRKVHLVSDHMTTGNLNGRAADFQTTSSISLIVQPEPNDFRIHFWGTIKMINKSKFELYGCNQTACFRKCPNLSNKVWRLKANMIVKLIRRGLFGLIWSWVFWIKVHFLSVSLNMHWSYFLLFSPKKNPKTLNLVSHKTKNSSESSQITSWNCLVFST